MYSEKYVRRSKTKMYQQISAENTNTPRLFKNSCQTATLLLAVTRTTAA